VPLERAFALRPEQRILRKGWRTDLAYFFVSTLFLQVLTVLTLSPAMVFFDWARHDGLAAWIAGLPGLAAFGLIVVVSDFTQYWIHRLFHAVPALWRFHEIHHSAEVMDWLAGSRLHLVDIVVTRGLTYVPIYVMGFAAGPFFAYLVFVSVQAVFIHANVRFRLGWLHWLLATPRYHHWHHAAEPEAVDKNFAVHLPVIDRLFGTYYLPDRWPRAYGVTSGSQVPAGWGRQLVHAFRRRKSRARGPV
jgi:lathosterol oxidase